MAFKKKVDIGNSEQFKFEQPGQTLEGYFVGTFEHDGDYGPTSKHIFSTESGLQTVFGQTHLTQLLSGLPAGVLCRVTLVGTKKMKKGNPMKVYELEYDEDQVIDVDAVAAQSNQSVDDVEEDAVEEEVESEPAPRPLAARPTPAKSAAAPKPAVTAEQRARVNALLGKRT